MKRLLVVGAGGDVGQGVVAAALELGWKVAAAGRTAERLQRLQAKLAAPGLKVAVGDLRDEAAAGALWDAAASALGGLDAVVIAVNAPNAMRPLLTWTAAELLEVYAANVLTHFNAAKVFLPRLPANGVFLGIGGGTADFVIPKLGQLSMAQAAERMMYRAIARERREGAEVRELMIASMVNGESSRSGADPAWVTDLEVGRHACAIVAEPAAFPGPVIILKSREPAA
jgi:NAD(P)-dependent dehydrogenase (short-subunit alcohol dehydrogenase family)